MARLGEIYLTGRAAPDTATPAALLRLEESPSQDSLLRESVIPESSVGEKLAEVGDGRLEAILEADRGLPSEQCFGLFDVRLTLLRIIARQGLVADLRRPTHLAQDFLRELQDCELVRIADIDRTSDRSRRVHHQHHRAHQIVHVAEAAALLAIAEDGDVLATQGLHDEIRDHTAVVGMLAWTIGIENAHDLDVQPVSERLRFASISYGATRLQKS